jgi:23S rRNA (cytidine1920-2'-O)/16S rRNA (cytidine1409-2'-O)-methyltransferase
LSAKNRLDIELVNRGLVLSRSQAESYIKLGKVKVNEKVITKPGYFVKADSVIKLFQAEQFVSRAGLKLASASVALNLDFTAKTVLDVGSSTGGFSDFALKNGAKKVYAVDVGTNQLHPSLRPNPKIELHEQTDIRKFVPKIPPDIILIDVSFISLRQILPHIAKISAKNTLVVAMLKPQFEAEADMKHKGVIKNDSMRRQIIKSFEEWVKTYFVIRKKSDSAVAGEKGNVERFYLLSPL